MKKHLFSVTAGFVFLSLIGFGCSLRQSEMDPVGPGSQVTALSARHTSIAWVIAIQNKHTEKLMKTAGVVGTATAVDESGEPVITVFTKAHGHEKGVPAVLENVRVVVEVSGEFHAYAKPSGGGVSHTAKQTAPVKLGTSGGWTSDLANGYCCGGTLGSLVTDGVKQYILSNYHVFQSDIVAGGNGIVAQPGDAVIQPGLIDVGCVAGNAQQVATLSAFSFPASLPNSNVDAAIAEVVPGMVDATGAILEIGALSSAILAPALNQAVKKSGRTSGLTRSTIVGLNATISVIYDNECAGGDAFTKTFTGQIVVNSRRGFLKGGDSGSLLVQDASTNPRPIGLLFAGSQTSAIANPIGEVLAHFGANADSTGSTTFSMVGN